MRRFAEAGRYSVPIGWLCVGRRVACGRADRVRLSRRCRRLLPEAYELKGREQNEAGATSRTSLPDGSSGARTTHWPVCCPHGERMVVSPIGGVTCSRHCATRREIPRCRQMKWQPCNAWRCASSQLFATDRRWDRRNGCAK